MLRRGGASPVGRALPGLLLVTGATAFPLSPSGAAMLQAFPHTFGLSTRSAGSLHPGSPPSTRIIAPHARRSGMHPCCAFPRLLLRGGAAGLRAYEKDAAGEAEGGVAPSREERKQDHINQVQQKLEAIAAGEKGLGKVRQHVNPLKSQFQIPTEAPSWSEVYGDPTLPMHLDIGCGKGRFLLELAAINSDTNHYGVEIREPLVVRANKWAQDAGLRNCHFSFANMNASIRTILKGYAGRISLVTLLMPDPWFKARHHKRRVVNPEFVEALAEEVPSGARLIVGSDVRDVYDDIVYVLGNSTAWVEVPGGSDEWPLERQTERQISVQSRGEALYHSVYTRR